METDNFFQESQAQIPKMLIWAGRFYRFQKPLFGNFYGDLPDQWSWESPHLFLFLRIIQNNLEQKTQVWSSRLCAPSAPCLSWVQYQNPELVLGCGSMPHGESRKTKMSSLVAGHEPTASQVKHQSSITSFREEPHTFLHTHTHTHTHTHPNPQGTWLRPLQSTLFLEMPGLRQGKQGVTCWHSGDTESYLPPCCAVQQGLSVHHWESWDSHTPADLLAQNSQACEGHRTSWVPWDQLLRCPLTNQYRWTLLALLPLLCFM